MGFPRGSMNLPSNAEEAGDDGLIPESGRSPGGGNGNPLQYSCLENRVAQGAWATFHGISESDMNEWMTTTLFIGKICFLHLEDNSHALSLFFFMRGSLFKKFLFVFCAGSLLGLVGSLVLALELLSCSMWDLIPWAGIKPRSLALGALSVSH